MGITADTGKTNRRNAFARRALAVCTLFALAFVAFGCGGGEAVDQAGTPTQNVPAVTPAASLPSVPTDSAEKAGFLVYRDTLASQVFALNLATGERHSVTGIIPTAIPTITSFDCSRDGRLIAYSNSAGNGQVSIISFAGEGARSQSVEVQGGIVGMAWEPGADRLAMSVVDRSGYRIMILDANSGEQTTLSSIPGAPGAPRWSPDGQRLVFDINQNGHSDIYVLDVGNAAAGPVKVSSRPAAFTPDWSPDGQTIIFTSTDNQGGFPQVFAVQADGTNERQVTTSHMEKWSPRWSLDGSLISYAGLVLVPAVSSRPVLAHNSGVWVAGADGTNESPVTDLALDAQPLAWCLRGTWLG
jgi:dipeptidyl aminopeptidase/acylaminoacyl peptidase